MEFLQHYWLVGFIVLAILMYFFAYAGFFVQQDAKKKGLGKAAVTFWSVGVVFFGPIFLPLYLVFRSRSVFAKAPSETENKSNTGFCQHCGADNPANEKFCAKCHKMLDSDHEITGEKNCPYCGALNPAAASRCKACDQVIGYSDSDDE
jgi:ribosomal protein L40E